MLILPGSDPGIYVSGGALDRRGVWGPGQRPVGAPGGRSPTEAHENKEFEEVMETQK